MDYAQCVAHPTETSDLSTEEAALWQSWLTEAGLSADEEALWQSWLAEAGITENGGDDATNPEIRALLQRPDTAWLPMQKKWFDLICNEEDPEKKKTFEYRKYGGYNFNVMNCCSYKVSVSFI